jgi:hypothetical protein
MRARTWTFTGWLLAGSITAGLVLLALILHLNDRSGKHLERRLQAKKDYDTLIKLRTQYRELEARINRLPPATEAGSQSPQLFLAQKAKEAGLPEPVIQSETPSRGPLKEQAYTVSLSGGSTTTVSRRQFVRFLELVESQRPSFKSKSITFKFAAKTPEDFERVSATFSHFER